MALFGTKLPEHVKEEREQEELLAKYGLTSLTDKDDIEAVKRISQQLTGLKLMEIGDILGGASERDMQRMLVYYQRAIMEQNFIIIRMLDRIANK